MSMQGVVRNHRVGKKAAYSWPTSLLHDNLHVSIQETVSTAEGTGATQVMLG